MRFEIRWLDWAMLGLLSLLWGSSFFWTKLALQAWPAAWIVSARLVVAAVFMLLVLRLLGRPMPKTRQAWLVFATLGFLTNLVPFTAYTASQYYISSSLAAVLNTFTPLSILILSQIFQLEDRLRWDNAAGCILGIVGVGLLLSPGISGYGTEQAIGIGLALLAALFYGLGSLYARRHQGIDPQVMATGMVSCAALYSIPSALVLEGRLPNLLTDLPQGIPLIALIMLGVSSTGAAYLIFFTLLKRVGPANASTVTLILPVTALLLGVVLLGERFTPGALFAMGLIFLGLLFIDGRLPRRVVERLRPTRPAA